MWVSTIHKAKGKESRTVLLPRLAEGLCPVDAKEQVFGTVEFPQGIAQSDPLEQERRIFYVGLTRASEVVFLEVPPHAPTPAPSHPIKKTRPTVRKTAEPEMGRTSWRPEEDAALQTGRANREFLDDLAAHPGRTRRAIDARVDILAEILRRTEKRRRLAKEE